MSRTLLFVYGLLQPGISPPRTMTDHWPDAVRGQLYELGEYPGAVGIGTGDTWIPGWTIAIDEAELALLDEFEDVDQGLYARIQIATRESRQAWVYEYRGSLIGAKLIKGWNKSGAVE